MNGIGACCELLQPFVDELPPELEVIRFDMPGLGGSPRPVLPYHLSTFAPLVGSLVRQLGHREVDVLGFSWGGALAQQFAITQRRLTRRLEMLTPRRHRDPAYTRRIAGEIYGGTMRTHPERAAHVLHAYSRAGPMRGYYYQLLAAMGWTSLPLLRLIRHPTLVIGGADDPLVPEVNLRIMKRGIPRSRCHVHAGGHLALLTEAAELAPVIDRFLAEPDLPH